MMDRFRDFDENIKSLESYYNCGLPFENQIEILSDADKLKKWLLEDAIDYDLIYENLTTLVSTYCDDSEVVNRLQGESDLSDEDEELLLGHFCNYIVNDFSFSWVGGCRHASDIKPNTKARLYRMVGVDSYDEFSFKKEHMGVCWTYDKDVLDEISGCKDGDMVLNLEADVEARGIDLLTSFIFVFLGYANENEVRLMGTDSVDLLKIYDDEWNVVWAKGEGWL